MPNASKNNISVEKADGGKNCIDINDNTFNIFGSYIISLSDMSHSPDL